MLENIKMHFMVLNGKRLPLEWYEDGRQYGSPLVCPVCGKFVVSGDGGSCAFCGWADIDEDEDYGYYCLSGMPFDKAIKNYRKFGLVSKEWDYIDRLKCMRKNFIECYGEKGDWAELPDTTDNKQNNSSK